MAVSVYVRALLKAAEILGGRKKLARYLQAPVADLNKWIAGEAEPPMSVFLRTVDLILDSPEGADDPGGVPPAHEGANVGGDAMWC